MESQRIAARESHRHLARVQPISDLGWKLIRNVGLGEILKKRNCGGEALAFCFGEAACAFQSGLVPCLLGVGGGAIPAEARHANGLQNQRQNRHRPRG